MKESVAEFLVRGGEIKKLNERKAKKSNSTFKPFATLTIAHKGKLRTELRTSGIRAN